MKKSSLLSLLLLVSCSSFDSHLSKDDTSSKKESSFITNESITSENDTLKLKDVLLNSNTLNVENINFVQIATYASSVQPGYLKENAYSEDKDDFKTICDFINNTLVEEVDSSEGNRYGGFAYNYLISTSEGKYSLFTTDYYFSIRNKYYKLNNQCSLKNISVSQSFVTYDNEIDIYKDNQLIANERNVFFDMCFVVKEIEIQKTSLFKVVADFGECYIYNAKQFSFVSIEGKTLECNIIKGNDFSFIDFTK